MLIQSEDDGGTVRAPLTGRRRLAACAIALWCGVMVAWMPAAPDAQETPLVPSSASISASTGKGDPAVAASRLTAATGEQDDPVLAAARAIHPPAGGTRTGDSIRISGGIPEAHTAPEAEGAQSQEERSSGDASDAGEIVDLGKSGDDDEVIEAVQHPELFNLGESSPSGSEEAPVAASAPSSELPVGPEPEVATSAAAPAAEEAPVAASAPSSELPADPSLNAAKPSPGEETGVPEVEVTEPAPHFSPSTPESPRKVSASPEAPAAPAAPAGAERAAEEQAPAPAAETVRETTRPREPEPGVAASATAAPAVPPKEPRKIASNAPPKRGMAFGGLELSSGSSPIDIRSDKMTLDYQNNSVIFAGHVRAAQTTGQLTSDRLRVNYGENFHDVREMIADGNVRISQGRRFATGDHAVLDQVERKVVLTGSPVVHAGNDQITGRRITVYLDTGRSLVEGARAVIFPHGSESVDN